MPVTSTTPFLRWAGSKRQLLPQIAQQMPPSFGRYVEPFAGSACIFFGTCPSEALLTDFNEELILAYRVVKNRHIQLAKALSKMPTDESTYYDQRALHPRSLRSFDRAVRFVYLNSYCFNGVYRTNRKGDFNVPRGSRCRGVPSLDQLAACARLLRNAEVECCDFRETLECCTELDFVYLDPPYTKPGTRNRGEYGAESFSEADEGRLLTTLRQCDKRGVRFLLSYRATTSFVRQLPSSWHTQRLRVRRNVAGFASARRNALEVLVRNYEVTD